ncbi:MAG TPA: outer membrane protein assembly factor BamD [Burkholderiales bacterium]|nr:outer membrane protein assembly factor BamD [Burkholderiales bacterium]
MQKIIHVMRRIVLLVVALAFAGCASVLDPTKDWTDEEFYNDAKNLLDNERYEDAIKRYEQLQGRFPYGRYAEQSQLDIAYAYFRFEEPALALSACDRFIRQYPTHPNVDYAYYLKGYITFPSKYSVVNWLFRIDDDLHDRDIKGSREAYDAFKELVQRFPQSRYAEDAKLRMDYLFQSQARHEVSVARYYYDRGAYVAAVNRTKHALENFPRTPAIEDALAVQAMSYKKMGITKLFDDTLRVLKLNFPQSRYLEEISRLG